AAAGLPVERPAETVLHEPGLVFLRPYLPQLLDADAEFLRLAAFGEVVASNELLGERAARTLPDQHILAEQFHAGLIVRAVRSVALHAHVAGCHPNDGVLIIVKDFGGCEAGIDLDAQSLGLAGKPAADISERDDVVAMVVHERR